MAVSNLSREELERVVALIEQTTNYELVELKDRKTKRNPNPPTRYALRYTSGYGYDSDSEYLDLTEEQALLFKRYNA